MGKKIDLIATKWFRNDLVAAKFPPKKIKIKWWPPSFQAKKMIWWPLGGPWQSNVKTT
jgi:hypothetical protein